MAHGSFVLRRAGRTATLLIAASILFTLIGGATAHAARHRHMIVGLNAGNFGTAGLADVRRAVRSVRLDRNVGSNTFRSYGRSGAKIVANFSGPYTQAGLGALNPAAWVAQTLGFYAASCSTSSCPWIQVLNEPYWPRWWGPNADSQANANAYALLLRATWQAFHARYGKHAPKILAACEDQDWNRYWCDEWRHSKAVPNALRYVDGVTLHAYGGISNRSQSARGTRANVAKAHRVTGKPVYVTEVGWPTATQCGHTGDSFQWSPAQQAANIRHFMNWARRTRYVAATFYFNYRDFGPCDWYGIETASGRHKPAYNALKAEAHR